MSLPNIEYVYQKHEQGVTNIQSYNKNTNEVGWTPYTLVFSYGIKRLKEL